MLNIDWKSLFKEIVRVVIAALAGATAGGCALVPVFS